MQACDAEFIEGFSKESIATNRGEEVESFSKRCIVQLFLESYQLISVDVDLYG